MKSALRYDALGITRVHGKPLGTAGKILVEFTNSKLADVCRVVVEVVMRKLVKRTELARRHHSTSVSVLCTAFF
jgi:hypothetical protein